MTVSDASSTIAQFLSFQDAKKDTLLSHTKVTAKDRNSLFFLIATAFSLFIYSIKAVGGRCFFTHWQKFLVYCLNLKSGVKKKRK